MLLNWVLQRVQSNPTYTSAEAQCEWVIQIARSARILLNKQSSGYPEQLQLLWYFAICMILRHIMIQAERRGCLKLSPDCWNLYCQWRFQDKILGDNIAKQGSKWLSWTITATLNAAVLCNSVVKSFLIARQVLQDTTLLFTKAISSFEASCSFRIFRLFDKYCRTRQDCWIQNKESL